MVAKELGTALRIFASLFIITGLLYPMLVTLCGQALFPKGANGSLITDGGALKGSMLLAQKFTRDEYFHSRPSATDYATVPTGASNLSPASTAFKAASLKLRAIYGKDAPNDLLTTSASGLDPHISPRAAFYQLLRIARSRGLGPEGLIKLQHLVAAQVERPTFGFLGNLRINVLRLNLLLDREFQHE